jgi:hypothetical protein
MPMLHRVASLRWIARRRRCVWEQANVEIDSDDAWVDFHRPSNADFFRECGRPPDSWSGSRSWPESGAVLSLSRRIVKFTFSHECLGAAANGSYPPSTKIIHHSLLLVLRRGLVIYTLATHQWLYANFIHISRAGHLLVLECSILGESILPEHDYSHDWWEIFRGKAG